MRARRRRVLWDAAGTTAIARWAIAGYAQFGLGVLVEEGGRDDYRLGAADRGRRSSAPGCSSTARRRPVRDPARRAGYGGPEAAGRSSISPATTATRRSAIPRGRAGPTAGRRKGGDVECQGPALDGGPKPRASWREESARSSTYPETTSTGAGRSVRSGYWFGTGVLATAGRRSLRGVWYAQARRALRLGTLSTCRERPVRARRHGGAGLGFGWDFAAGLFRDESGNDRYVLNAWARSGDEEVGRDLRRRAETTSTSARRLRGLGYVDDDPRGLCEIRAPRWHEGSQAASSSISPGTTAIRGAGANGARWGTFEPASAPPPRETSGGTDLK